jgi:hypothetical protein
MSYSSNLFCYDQSNSNVGFESLMVVVPKCSIRIFCDITPCSRFKVNRHFERTCHLQLQGRRISQAKNLCLLRVSRWILPWIILRPWRWKRHVPLKHWFIFKELHGVISQKIEPLTVTHLSSCIAYLTTLSVTILCNLRWYDDCWTRKDLEVNSRGLIKVVSQRLPSGTKENHERH